MEKLEIVLGPTPHTSARSRGRATPASQKVTLLSETPASTRNLEVFCKHCLGSARGFVLKQQSQVFQRDFPLDTTFSEA